jgi:hypothetical protein
MPFQKGHKKFVSKKTATESGKIQDMLQREIQKMASHVKTLTGQEHFEAMKQLLPYLQAKQKETKEPEKPIDDSKYAALSIDQLQRINAIINE